MGSWGKAARAWGSDSNNSSSKGMEWGARGILCGAAQAPGGTPSPICWPWSGETEKWGKGLSSLPCLRQTPPQVYPQETLWGGRRAIQPHSQPAVTVTQGPSLSNWPKLVGVTPGKDRTNPPPLPAFPPLLPRSGTFSR